MRQTKLFSWHLLSFPMDGFGPGTDLSGWRGVYSWGWGASTDLGDRTAEGKQRENFLQGLEPILSKPCSSGLKPRPPKEKSGRFGAEGGPYKGKKAGIKASATTERGSEEGGVKPPLRVPTGDIGGALRGTQGKQALIGAAE